MARQELARRLEELNMSNADAKGYGALLEAVQSHIALLFDLFESGLVLSLCACGQLTFTNRSGRERRGTHMD